MKLTREAQDVKNAKQREWYHEHPEKAKEYNKRYWERKSNKLRISREGTTDDENPPPVKEKFEMTKFRYAVSKYEYDGTMAFAHEAIISVFKDLTTARQYADMMNICGKRGVQYFVYDLDVDRARERNGNILSGVPPQHERN